jgi:signal transduction histidine kinase
MNQKEILNYEVKVKTSQLEKNKKQLQEINENLEQKIIIEVEKNKKVQEQLFKSEKMASMGEMIGNIAHQWRQPLSIISTGITGLKVQKEMDMLPDTIFYETCDTINDNVQYLSKTIDDFKNFIKGDHKIELFNLTQYIKSFLHIINASTKKHHINIVTELDDEIEIYGYPNELIQSFINLFNNAKDAMDSIEDEERYIFISSKKEQDYITICFQDNGKGINEDIIDKIFEPYFTTKHKSQGTGLGMHMTYNLIVNGMKGNIKITNAYKVYKDKNFYGAKFTITLPLLDPKEL